MHGEKRQQKEPKTLHSRTNVDELCTYRRLSTSILFNKDNIICFGQYTNPFYSRARTPVLEHTMSLAHGWRAWRGGHGVVGRDWLTTST